MIDSSLINILLPGQEPLVSHEYKFIYQPLTKVGCKSIKSWMLLLKEVQEQDFDPNNSLHLEEISKMYTSFTYRHYDKEDSFHIHNLANKFFGAYTNGYIKHPFWELDSKLESYKKIVFVRNPWNRIASCYVDKVTSKSQYYRIKQMQEWFREQNYKEEFFDKDGRFTFEGFLEAVGYVIDNKVQAFYDPHWLPQKTAMEAFIDEYDYIGRIESLDNDIKEVQSLFYIPAVHVGNVDKTIDKEGNYTEQKSSAGKYEKFFLNYSNIDKVVEIYNQDIELLNYTYE